MLRLVRNHLKIILWTAVIAFVLWEIGTVLSMRQGPSVYAGTLFGQSVAIQEYQQALDAARHRAQLTYGDRAMEFLPPDELGRQAWDTLMLTRAARRAGIRVGDQEVVAELSRWPIFQQEGQFNPKVYRSLLQYSLGTTPRAFEEEVRSQLAMVKLMNQAAGTPTITDAELEAAYRRQEEQIRAAYVVVDPGAFESQVVITEPAVERYYQAHRAEFQSDPKAEIQYLKVTPEGLHEGLAVSEADCLEEYLRQAPESQQSQPPSHDQLETIRQRLLTARAKERAADLAWELRGRWRETPDLARLGQTHGLTPEQPPAFGIREPIAGVPSSSEIADAAFALHAGELSKVLETPDGYYLVTLIRQVPSRELSAEEAAPKIRQVLRGLEAKRLAKESAENLFASVQELAMAKSPDPLTPIAREAGLEVNRTDLIKRTSDVGRYGNAALLLGGTFELDAGQVGGPWGSGRGWVITQLLERTPIDQAQFAKAKDTLKGQLVERKRAEAVNRWVLKLRVDANPRPNPPVATTRPSATR